MADKTSDQLKLPEDLLVEILIRSSVKSLLRAKCVCKKWYVLIRNTNFVYKHLEYQKSHNKGRLLLCYYKGDTKECKYALFDDETLARNSYCDLDHLKFPCMFLHMEGPVNGLYCIFNNSDRMIVWNPALMEVRMISLPQAYAFSHSDYNGVIGFGMDPLSHDYKLVLIRDIYFEKGLYVTVYNLNTDTWKNLDLDDDDLSQEGLDISYNSSFLSGVYYWWNKPCWVIAFDMAEETFRRILGPDLSISQLEIVYLTIYNDKVALLSRNEFSVDMWLMLEEGVWIKQFSMTTLPNYFWIVGLWKNGELIISMDGFETSEINPNFQTVLWNDSTQEIRSVGPRGNPLGFRASIYYESLVSVGGGTHHKGKCASLNTISDFLMGK